jgi:anaerobic selenocysteine-containing dehydrogenase
MSDGSFLNKLRFFRPNGKKNGCQEEKTADNWAEIRCGQREWEDFYRRRWQYDKKVRSTHGINCTGSCSWDVYVKNGILVWETQRTDYPDSGEGYPNHEPRGCPRGATYSWYTCSPVRLKYPLVRSSLMEMWQNALQQNQDPVVAWKSIIDNPEKRRRFQKDRGKGGFVRASWEQVAIMAKKVSCDLAASTGVHDGNAVIKQTLAGADAFQVVSCLYKNGNGYIREMLDGVENWVVTKGFESLSDFKGWIFRLLYTTANHYMFLQIIY